LQNRDLVIIHVEAPDEAGHGALVEGKIQAVENIDKYITGPLLKYLQGLSDDWRIMVTPDHPTPIRVRTHTSEPVPFAMTGTGIASPWKLNYSEAKAQETGLRIDKGHELMEYFLKGKG